MEPTTQAASPPSSGLNDAVTRALGARREVASLPELFDEVAKGRSIGEFHDVLRTLAAEGRIRLRPYTGPMYRLERGQYALVTGSEVQYYASASGEA